MTNSKDAEHHDGKVLKEQRSGKGVTCESGPCRIQKMQNITMVRYRKIREVSTVSRKRRNRGIGLEQVNVAGTGLEPSIWTHHGVESVD